MLQVIDIIEGTSVDGPGLRTSVYFAGCKHKCIGCHNPQSWSFDAGKAMSIDEVMSVIRENDFNVTLSGGDPMYSALEIGKLCQRIKEELHKNIWCYTGFLWEDIVGIPEYMCIIKNIDVLVDGPFMLNRRDTSLCFRGSGNQRIIDVKKSMECNRPIVLDY